MWRAKRSSTAGHYFRSATTFEVPRPPRVFPGTHVHSRDYKTYHYTTRESAGAIKKSGKLMPGNGNRGKGIYFTRMHANTGHSNEEIKTSVRNPNIPDERVAEFVSVDTDILDQKNIPYKVYGNTVFVPSEEPLEVKDIADFGSNPHVSED